MKTFNLTIILGLFVLTLSCGNNKYSSAEATFLTLVKAANENDVKTFMSGIDLVSTLQLLGTDEKEIKPIVEELIENIDESKYSEMKANLIKMMESMASANHTVLNEEDAGIKRRILIVRSKSKTYGNEYTVELNFIKRDNNWLLNPN